MWCFFLVLNSRTCFRYNDFKILHKHKKFRWPLLYHLFSKAVHLSALVEPNQMKQGFVITNDKASNVAKRDRICLFSVAKETKTLCPFINKKKNLKKLNTPKYAKVLVVLWAKPYSVTLISPLLSLARYLWAAMSCRSLSTNWQKSLSPGSDLRARYTLCMKRVKG